MANYTFSRHIIILLLFIAMANISASQEAMLEVKLQDQVQLSNQIVEGEVISKQSFWDDAYENIYTKHTIQVYKVFKGQPLTTLEVITKGGIVDLEAQVVSHSVQLRKGDVGMFMLVTNNFENLNIELENPSKAFKSASGIQGFYKYNLETDKVANTFKSYNGITADFHNELLKNSAIKMLEIQPNSTYANKTTSKSSNSMAALTITSFTASNNSAGTKSVLTINGNGFGSNKGTIGFSNANYGGALHTNTLDNQILGWTDTKIEVEIPDEAGTGSIMVNTLSNGSIESTEDIIIDFSQINLAYDVGSGDEDFQTQHVDMNNEGGITWTINGGFYNSEAMSPFEQSLSTWSCESGINWEVGATTNSNTLDSYDGVNLITLGSLPSGTLGQTFSAYSGCYQDGEIKWYVTDTDIIFNSNINWNFAESNPQYNEIDFKSVAVHELGHAHQLGHVVDTNVVMHYSLSSGEMQRSLSPEDIDGANDIQYRNMNLEVCGKTVITQSSGSCSQLGTDDFYVEDAISVYPNPTSSNVFVKVKSGLNIENIAIYNLEGRQVHYSIERNNQALKSIDTSRYAKGIYLIKIDTDLGTISKKLILI